MHKIIITVATLLLLMSSKATIAFPLEDLRKLINQVDDVVIAEVVSKDCRMLVTGPYAEYRLRILDSIKGSSKKGEELFVYDKVINWKKSCEGDIYLGKPYWNPIPGTTHAVYFKKEVELNFLQNEYEVGNDFIKSTYYQDLKAAAGQLPPRIKKPFITKQLAEDIVKSRILTSTVEGQSSAQDLTTRIKSAELKNEKWTIVAEWTMRDWAFTSKGRFELDAESGVEINTYPSLLICGRHNCSH